jgi:signal transduction histidine kinase/CheY-like chemotaxis protein
LLCAGEEILFSNPTATQMLSLADTDAFVQLPDALKQARAGDTGELTQTAPDGSTTWLEYRTRAVHAGIRSGLLISLTDVTQRKANEKRRLHAERELLKGQHMEQIGLLAGGVAHDINNMMSVVEVNGGILLETMADPATREVVEDIVGAGQATAELVRQLLAYAGGQKTRLHTIDLDGEAVRAARLWRSEARSRHIQMHIEGAGQPLQIEADAGLLQQVVSNLISNALRHTPATGTVQVKLSRALLQESDLAAADLSAATAGEFAILSVLDSGCGLSPEVRSRMFQPFFTTHQAGRGLGLSAVQGIVQRLRGAIFAESSPSGGTCFRVALPLSSRDASHSEAPELVATDSQPPIDRQARSSLRVLVVEDSVLVRRQICRVLTRAGMTALPASDLAEALTVAEQGVDAAVIDFFLEVETGDEVLQMLRTLYPRLPAVLCSGYVGADSERNVTQGFQAFIPKPFKPEKLVTTVRELTASDWEPA